MKRAGKMKKKKFTLRTVTDIKVFLLFLLEYIRYPVDRTTLINIVSENTDEIIIDYDGCLGELTDSGHVWFDEVDGESYYMISDSGRMVARELFDTLDEDFREKSLKCATKHLSLAKSGATTKPQSKRLRAQDIRSPFHYRTPRVSFLRRRSSFPRYPRRKKYAAILKLVRRLCTEECSFLQPEDWNIFHKTEKIVYFGQ